MGAPTLRVRVTRDAERQIRGGHPWVFSKSIRSIEGGGGGGTAGAIGTAGQLGVIYDHRNRFLAIGLYDPESPIVLRVLAAGSPARIDSGFWTDRVAASLGIRRALVEGGVTDGFRVINGESDGFPGLVADIYAGTLVVKIYTPAWLPWLGGVTAALGAALAPERILLRRSRKVAEATGAPTDGELIWGAPGEETVVFRENGLRFEAAVIRGQKTGFFLDQRDNRQRVRELARGRSILDLFSFSGAFSVAAAAGGARAVTAVDISPHALASGERNFALNADAVGACKRFPVKADVFAWLREPAERRFDLVIVDPPSLAQRAADRERAVEAYARLNRAAAGRVAPGGLLVAASCSAHVDTDTFFATVRDAVGTEGWRVRETTGHALDHPATIREANYLKAIFLERG